MKNNNTKSSASITSTSVFILLVIIIITRNDFFSLLQLYLENPIQVFVNFIIICAGTYGAVSLIFLPIWRLVFQETGKLGQKIEWYDSAYKHLIPQSRSRARKRLVLILCISVVLKVVASNGGVLAWLNYQELIPISKNAVSAYFRYKTSFWFIILSGAEFMATLILVTALENRSRILSRLLEKMEKYNQDSQWKQKLPLPSEQNRDEFSLNIMSKFTTATGEDSLKPSSNEEWLTLNQKTLLSNMMIIAPTGGGKTQSIILPIIEQAIGWNKSDLERKATLAIYDPKAELTKYVEEIAERHGRSEDVVILSLTSKSHTNIIKVDKVWDGTTSWRVAGWIVSAWQNYQGKSSPEPFWESQSYQLVRNILVMLYVEKGNSATIADVSRSFLDLSEGVFKKVRDPNSGKVEKHVTQFGRRILSVKLAVSRYSELAMRELDEYRFTTESEEVFDESIKELALERIDEIKNSYFEEMELQNPALLKESILIIETQLSNVVDEGLKSSLQLKILDLNDKLRKVRSVISKKEKEWKEQYESFLIQEKIKKDSEIIHEKLSLNIRNENLDKDEESQLFSIQNNMTMVHEAVTEIIKGSNTSEEQRSNILSNMRPFLQLFQGQELERSISNSSENVDFQEIIRNGKILVPDYPGISVGNELSNAVITLVKSRWQQASIDEGNNPGRSQNRLKFQIMDEAQRIISLGDQKHAGDFDYMEISRSMGGITVMCSQSIASLKAKASRDIDWQKVHGVIRNIICFGTNDTNALREMREIAGQSVVKRMSKTISEGASTPTLDVISEKYKGDSSSMSVSYTESEAKEDRVAESDIQTLPMYTSIGYIFDTTNKVYCLAHKPYFWPHMRDKWILMQKCEYSLSKRFTVLYGQFLGGILQRLYR